MQRIWSARHKFELWRKIWLAVAEAEHEVTKDWPETKGRPPLVSAEQVAELRANLDVTDADIEAARTYEKELRHDVMSHVHAWGDRCPGARGIIHLGMTSQDVNDNCELLILNSSIHLIYKRAEHVVSMLGTQANKNRRIATTGYTHYQPAQPTTLGRRCIQWAHDLDISNQFPHLPLRGLRGATGTQASFLKLLNGDSTAVDDLELLSVATLSEVRNNGDEDDADYAIEWLRSWRDRYIEGERQKPWEETPSGLHFSVVPQQFVFDLTGQTYSRVVDAQVMGSLANIAVVLHKIATDIRLLCNLGELSEPFETNQIGSSAMPYKRNPMRCERVCGLCRFVWNLVPNAYDTAATQWLERTLDDSSNRRLVLPEAFLALDAALNIMHNVIGGLVVHEKVIARNLERELPFLATEALMMAAVSLGRDRQDVHEAIRQHAMAAKHRMVEGDGENDLVERLRGEPLLEGVDIDAELVPERHIGLAVEQTERFLKEVIEPLREEHGADDSAVAELDV